MIKRFLSPLVKNSLKLFPAVLINGARQVGKSTLVQQLVKEGVVKEYVSLDDLNFLEIAQNNPKGFIEQFKESVAIDEIQRAPNLLPALKKYIDENRIPGRFLLTGSANLLSVPGVSESLAGRLDIMTLEGLSVGEVIGQSKPSSFIEDLFSGACFSELASKWKEELQNKPYIKKEQIIEYIYYGGFPEVLLKKNPYFRTRWFSSYHTAYIERDVRDLSRILDIVSFGKLFKLLGLQTGNLVNYKTLGIESKLDQRTVSRYIEILEITFQIKEPF